MSFGFPENSVGQINVRTVIELQQSELDCLVGIFLQQVFEQKAVAEAFGHFLSVYLDKPVMSPEFRKLFSRKTFGLRNLVFVMGKYQVASAAV